ncbi:MAG TPA: nicotinate phosphoribosyltransferase [Geothermobacteraceae bacterium]|nr:nicotinate phosphoribosyltransferase [Geothermobacteraceae bacterium]
MTVPALMTDLYQLTMLAGYQHQGMEKTPAVFDLYFRTPPYQGSYAVFAGLQPALDYLHKLRFTDAELGYLESLGLFRRAFLDYLKAFRFSGRVTAPAEGSVVFPHEPLITVEAPLAEAQLVETALLNIINFQTLVATKAARITQAAAPATVVEFGLRRAQGPDGALSVARAAYIGGVRSTSNLQAGAEFGIPVKGTHAHSWIMAFDDELSAFRAYAELFPDNCILLVDTYDTLASGVPNAITVAAELRTGGHELLGIRLDSGDLAYLSKSARKMFDAAGFPEVKIVASNELDEQVIHSIRSENGRVDLYGVGTRLATCAGEGGGALGGVYKLVEYNGSPRMKFTAEAVKSTLPGKKKVLRLVNGQDKYAGDIICRLDDRLAYGDLIYDPENPSRQKRLGAGVLKELHREVMNAGAQTASAPSLDALADHAASELKRLPEGSLRLHNPHRYKVSISESLYLLRDRLHQS